MREPRQPHLQYAAAPQRALHDAVQCDRQAVNKRLYRACLYVHAGLPQSFNRRLESSS